MQLAQVEFAVADEAAEAVPGGQSVQLDARAADQEPGGQAAQPGIMLPYWPALQVDCAAAWENRRTIRGTFLSILTRSDEEQLQTSATDWNSPFSVGKKSLVSKRLVPTQRQPR